MSGNVSNIQLANFSAVNNSAELPSLQTIAEGLFAEGLDPEKKLDDVSFITAQPIAMDVFTLGNAGVA